MGDDASCLTGKWEEKRWMNTPGPFYTGDADFALMGPMNVPQHLAVDAEHIEVVFRQPRNSEEATEILNIARIDAFEGYATNGSSFWSPVLVREWWSRRQEILDHITNSLVNKDWFHYPEEPPLVHAAAMNWKAFLETEASTYLRKYCYFLENRKWPTDREKLPDL
jgi:hypothetical protein